MVNGSIYVEALSAVQKQQVLEARQLPYQEVSERICSRLLPQKYNLDQRAHLNQKVRFGKPGESHRRKIKGLRALWPVNRMLIGV